MATHLFARALSRLEILRFENVLRFLIVSLGAVALGGACLAVSAAAQTAAPIPAPAGMPSAETSTVPGSPVAFGNSSPDPGQMRMMHKMFKERNAIRQRTIVDDTDRLLDLAKQLKQAVDKSSKDQLSLEVVNTASEIEKLAKSVKEKMRDGE